MKGASLHPNESMMIAYAAGSPIARAAIDSWKFHEDVVVWKADDPRLKQTWGGF